jgi:oligopeptide/dipeptide ABC transporter ATP-binding protein
VSDVRGPLLLVEHLDVSFATSRGPLRAVQDVSFALEHGKTLGIVGESGSGKTVLSRAIMGLLPMASTTQTGSVRYDGTEILNAPADDLRKLWSTHIAMVFQDPMTSLNPVQRIGNQITEPLKIHLKLSKSEAKETALSLLMQVGIPSPVERFEAYPAQLSGGMRQRVMIAIALACAPRLLLADEPTTGLDVTVQAQILDLLGKLQHEREMAMILVTHDLGVVATRTDDIIVMYAGNVVERAPTNVLFKSMAMPYTEALLNSTPRLTNPSHTRLTAIDGRPPDLLSPPAGCPFSPRCPYAQEKCSNEKPPLVEAEPGHSYACWYPLPAGTGRSPLPIRIPDTTADANARARDLTATDNGGAADTPLTTAAGPDATPDAEPREATA